MSSPVKSFVAYLYQTLTSPIKEACFCRYGSNRPIGMFLSPPPSLYVHHLETAFLALSALTLLIALFPLLTTADRKAAPDKKKSRMKSLDKIR